MDIVPYSGIPCKRDNSEYRLYIVPDRAFSRQTDKPPYFLSVGLFNSVLGNCRVSGKNRVSGSSLSVQEEHIRETCRLYEVSIVGMERYQESGTQAGIGPRLMGLIERASRENLIIAVDNIDRLGIGKNRQSIQRFESQLTCDVFCMVCHLGGKALDKEESLGGLMAKIAISERIKKGIERMKKVRKERSDKYSNPEVEKLIALYHSKGVSGNMIAQILNAKSIASPKGKTWNRKTVLSIIKRS